MTIIDDTAAWVASEVTHLSLHTDDPGSDGSNEVSGGGYARIAPTYVQVIDGLYDLDANLEFDGTAGTEVLWIGWWTASGWWHGEQVASFPEPMTFNLDGRLDLKSAPIKTRFPT